MNWTENRILFKNKNQLVFKYNIKNVLEFDKAIVVHISPNNESEYKSFKEEFGIEFKKGPVYKKKKKGELLWQWKTRYVNHIEKVTHGPEIVICKPLNMNSEEVCDLLISCSGINFYLNPKTGGIIRQEQNK